MTNLKISHVLVNRKNGSDIEHDMSRHAREILDMLDAIMQHYPSTTSIVVTLVRSNEYD